MSVDPSIFKAYDIRGTYPDQLNEEVAYKIGAAFANYLKPKAVAIGRDMR
ncbi:MAG: phosphomannomutase/phosphoglucomutase, partial [candidate division Zixibacteria bacterium]|nr:phosphomannomutase/phosphoglucomutase [candidate division Zixibacteria bacterium]